LALAVTSLLLVVGLDVNRHGSEGVAVSEDPTGDPAPGERADLVFEGLSIVEEERSAPSLVADRVRFAKRRSLGGLFVYHDLKDLLVSGAVVRLRPGSSDPDRGATPFDLLAELSTRFDAILPAGTSNVVARRDREDKVLSRVRFDGLSIVAEFANRRTLSIVAGRARADPEFESLAFDGPVTITDGVGRELRAVEAVWSREFAGIYLPGGHWIQDRYEAGEAFFVVSSDGILASRLPVPSIAYHDEIEEMEAEIVGKVFGDVPPALKAVLGIVSDP
jgi:hypothetical protein